MTVETVDHYLVRVLSVHCSAYVYYEYCNSYAAIYLHKTPLYNVLTAARVE